MFLKPTLTVDLAAITANWETLREKFTGDETAAVVKANAYGLGMVEVATALSNAGCNSFFVATLDEAIVLRATLPDVRILVFHGVQKGEEFAFASHRLIPVLNSREQIERWKPVAAEHVHAVSALHIDTGMARLGLQPGEFSTLMEKEPTMLEACRVGLMMSHLACATRPRDAANARQLSTFRDALRLAPGIPASLCNSNGIFISSDYHFNLGRPGCALYGITAHTMTGLKHVATWNAPILMTRTLSQKQAVGYGATRTLKKGARVATVATGYADGYLRGLSNAANGYVGDHAVALVGRVSMDMLLFDVSTVPEALTNEGMPVTLLGDKDGIRVDDLAHTANTIGYEILTRIGGRVERIYK